MQGGTGFVSSRNMARVSPCWSLPEGAYLKHGPFEPVLTGSAPGPGPGGSEAMVPTPSGLVDAPRLWTCLQVSDTAGAATSKLRGAEWAGGAEPV